MAFPIALIGIILAAVSAAGSVVGGAVEAAPTNGDKYRKKRLRELETLVDEGLTPSQEEELRAIGLGAAGSVERETRSRRGDALALLPGGATARDILAAEATDTARARDTRLQIDNEVKRMDAAERRRLQQEQAVLLQQQEESQRRKKAAVTKMIGGVVDAASTAIGGTALANQESVGDNPEGVIDAAKRQAGVGNTPYNTDQGANVYGSAISQGGNMASSMTGRRVDFASGLVQRYIDAGLPPAVAQQLAAMPAEQRAELLSMYGIAD